MTEPAPDDFERARAAVAVSCLRWLGSPGPGAVAIEPFRHDPEAVRRLLAGGPTAPDDRPPMPPHPPSPPSPPHPLWDRWLDG